MEQERMSAPSVGTDSAVIVLHEIYGLKRHILDTREKFCAAGYDAFCPDLLGVEPFPYERQEEAYRYFMENVGFDTYSRVVEVAEGLRGRYERIFLVGFSIGATLAWLAANECGCDGIVCFYGSRIRDYLDRPPKCPALALFARHGESFDPAPVARALSAFPNVRAELVEAAHGFCDKYSRNHAEHAAGYAEAQAFGFLAEIARKKES